ncbi:MAG: universal stress protein [Candidatus Endonucleobacter sp. (ex Gigantidas childressi)]|nr:universal stress protein [Candidatus Endonucleobacter sp. (ex Gigantidas childressi)]
MPQYQHIMLAVNFDENANILIEKAIQQSRSEQASLSVIHVEYLTGKPYNGMFDTNTQKTNLIIEQSSNDAMKKLLANYCHPIESYSQCHDNLTTSLTEAVKKYKIDLLILGHHRHSWLGEMLTSVSEPVIRKMPCDILLIKVDK